MQVKKYKLDDEVQLYKDGFNSSINLGRDMPRWLHENLTMLFLRYDQAKSYHGKRCYAAAIRQTMKQHDWV